MRERDVAKPLDGHHGGNRFLHEREHPARTGVEQKRLLVEHEILVEAEPARDNRDWRADPIDAGSDLVDARAALGIGDHGIRPSKLQLGAGWLYVTYSARNI